MASTTKPPPHSPARKSRPPSPDLHSTRSFLDQDSHPPRPPFKSTHSSSSTPQLTPAELLTRLEGLLAAKASEIQLAGRLGESLLGQQAELEARIKELDQVQEEHVASGFGTRRARGEGGAVEGKDEETVGGETRQRLEALEEEMRKWDEGNSGMYQVVGTAASVGVPGVETATRTTLSPSPSSSRLASLPGSPSNRIKPLPFAPEAPTGDASASRRARNNAQHRNNDIELATEIGQSLLGEVRRLQGLLSEKEELLRESKEERDAAERAAESANVGRRAVEESVDKYKEENWNLEMASQELHTSLTDAQSSLQKAEQDRTRITKELSTTKDLLEGQRTESEQISAQLDALKARHETDMATMRKHSAGLQREKSDLVASLDATKAELLIKSRGIKRASATSTVLGLDGDVADYEPGEEDDDEEGLRAAGRRKTSEGFAPGQGDLLSEFDADSSIGSPAKVDAGDLAKQSMAHAQKTILTLRASLAREKAARIELRRQMGEAGLGWEDSEGGASSVEGTPVRNASARAPRGSARGRGSARRGGGAMRLPSRLGAADTSIDEDDEDEEMGDAFGATEDSPGMFDHSFPMEHDTTMSEDGTEFESPSRMARRSIDMDSESHLGHGESDDESALSHGPRESLATLLGRPGSIASIDQLNNRPMSGMFGAASDRSVVVPAVVVPAIVWADLSTMTDFPVPPPAPVFVPPPRPQVAHVAVQMTPEPVPIVAKSDFAGQTDAPIVIATKDSSASTDPAPQSVEVGTSMDVKKGVEMEIQTDPLPLPPTTIAAVQTLDDRALSSAHSLSSLGGLRRISDTPVILESSKTLRDLNGLRTGLREEGSDGESETEGNDTEFEDARESIFGRSPTPHGSDVAHTPTASLYTYADSMRSAKTYRTVQSVESDMEVLKGSAQRYKSNGRVPFAPIPGSARLLPEVVEVGVQTDVWEPAPIFIVAPPVVLQQRDNKRDSINTFGRSENDPIESSAATATAFLDEQSDAAAGLQPSLLNMSTGSGVTIMGPPPPRAQGRLIATPRTVNTRQLPTPARPTSPAPPDLLYRAQSPDFDGEYERRATITTPHQSIRTRSAISTQNLRGQTSTIRPQPSMSNSLSASAKGKAPVTRRQQSTADMSVHSHASRRASMASSRSSEDVYGTPRPESTGGGGDSTDPAVIHAITQTMIGEFLHKYTRRTIGKGLSEKRHQRFFWVHPYTKTLYWSSEDPGATSTAQSSAKSVYIEGVRQVLDPNPFPPGLHHGSIIIQTPNRQIRITATTRERHDMWFNAISYLIARPDVPSSLSTATSRADLPSTDPTAGRDSARRRMKSEGASETPTTSSRLQQLYNLGSSSESRLAPPATPRGTRGTKTSSGSTIKRPGTAAEEYERQTVTSPLRAVKGAYSEFGETGGSFEFLDRQDLIGSEMGDDDAWEGLENVRACCDGKHDVGTLSRRGHTHSHSHTHSETDEPLATPNRARSKSTTGTFSRRFLPSGSKTVGHTFHNTPLSALPTNTSSTLGKVTPSR